MDTRTAVANRIIELCMERHIAVYRLSIISGVPSSTLKNILNGGSLNPGIITIKKLCDGLGISLVEFFNPKFFTNLEQDIS
jgi:transcriptional regulator with XRE-family HTH domain